MESLCLRTPLEAANLMGPAACLGDLARPHLGGLVIGHIHQGEPAQELLGLYVGSVGNYYGAAGGVGAVDGAVLLFQPSGEDVDAGYLHLVRDRHGERPAAAEPLLGVVAHPLLVEVDEVFGHGISFRCGGPCGPRLVRLRTARGEFNMVVHETEARSCGGSGGYPARTSALCR